MLTNKVIVVTGGNGLLGKVISKSLRDAGAIVLCADISIDEKDPFQIYLDIAKEMSVKECIAYIIQKYKKIDGWINNAYPRTKDWGTKFEAIPFESWQKNVDMHMNGYFLCCQHVLEQMKIQEFGSVINMASIYGVVAPDFSIYEGTSMTMPAAYSAIKGGLVSLSRYLASYYGKYNIRVNLISPGGIFDNQALSFVEKYEKKTPMKRMGTPEDISPAIVFLMSDGASYITGHNLIIDGGWSAI
ncbi:MAG: oxidoreductase [Bacteroidetes bacterium]|nr:oxidoreductase [Bacteroidota bacterium]